MSRCELLKIKIMNVITIESDAFKEIVESINEIKSKLDSTEKRKPLSETWFDISETCQALHISKRTCQTYRDKGIIPFSQIAGKIYFRASDIQAHLEKHFVKSFNTKK